MASLALGCARGPAMRFTSPEALLAAVRETSSCSRAVSGDAKLFFQGDGRRLSGSVLYLAAAPERLRFDLISPFGVTLTTLTVDDGRFSLFDLGAKTLHHGPAKTCNVARFTRVPVPPLALVETLRGRPATIVHTSSELEFVSPFLGTPHYQVRLAGPHEAVQVLRIAVHPDDLANALDAQRFRYLGGEVSQAGEVSYRVRLSQFHTASNKPIPASTDPLERTLPPSGPVCDAELPGRIQFTVPSTGYEVTFDHTEQWHNPPLPEAAFRFLPTNGTTSIFADCQ